MVSCALGGGDDLIPSRSGEGSWPVQWWKYYRSHRIMPRQPSILSRYLTNRPRFCSMVASHMRGQWITPRTETDQMDALDLKSLFDASVSLTVQTALVGIVRAANDLALSFCFDEFDHPEARDLFPQIKRAFVERGISQIPDRYPRAASVETRVNTAGNSARVLRCNNICMTASFLSRDDHRLPRKAEFRNDLARDFNQMRLHPDEEHERVRKLHASMKEIYAILCHRSTPIRNSGEPKCEVTGATIVFVNERCRYIAEIDLIARTATRASEIEQIRDQVHTQLKGDLARGLRVQG